MVDRAELCRLLSSAINYANVGKQVEADAKARELVRELGCEGILSGGDFGGSS